MGIEPTLLLHRLTFQVSATKPIFAYYPYLTCVRILFSYMVGTARFELASFITLTPKVSGLTKLAYAPIGIFLILQK